MYTINEKLFLLILTAPLLVFYGGLAQAASVSCGEIIVTDTKLDTNLICDSEPPTDGLVIAANGVTLDLNGFTIKGSSEKEGVSGTGHSNITIKNGAITGFETGIHFDDITKLEIKQLTIANQSWDSILIGTSRNVKIMNVHTYLPEEAPGSAIILADVDDSKVTNVNVDGGFYGVLSIAYLGISKRFEVKNSVFARVGHVGVRILRNDGAFVINNSVSGTPACWSGIDVVDEGPNNEILILDNAATGCNHGINVATEPPATKLQISGNHVYGNVDGIFLLGMTDSVVSDNRVHFNNAGIVLWANTYGNKIVNNIVTGNRDVDMYQYPDFFNLWSGNTCVLTEGAYIDCP